MIHDQAVYAALIAAALVVNLPFLLQLLIQGLSKMQVSANAQPIVDELTNAAQALPAAITAIQAAANAQAEADLAAIKAAADTLTAAIAAATPAAN